MELGFPVPAGCPAGSATIYGRARGHRRPYALGPAPWGTTAGVGGLTRFVLTGPIVAYEQYREILGISASRVIVVRDLRTGRLLNRSRVVSGEASEPTISRLVLKSDGAAAWIVATNVPPDYFQIHTVDRTGSRVLATGLNIDPTSLTLRHDTIEWKTKAGPLQSPAVTMSAPLN